MTRLRTAPEKHCHGTVIWLAAAAGLFLVIGPWSLIVIGALTMMFLAVMILRDWCPF